MTAARAFVAVCIALLILLACLVVLVLGVLRLNSLANVNRHNGEYIIECTTAGPKPPPNTGHPCFDAGQKRTGQAVAQIIDQNGNGIPDLTEMAEALGVSLPTTTTTTTTRSGA